MNKIAQIVNDLLSLFGEKVIAHEGGKWVLYSRDRSKKLGTFDTEEEAKKRERQIQFFRHQKADDNDDYEPTDEEILAAIEVLREAGLLKEASKQGNVQRLISTFGSWAGGRHTQCVSRLRAKRPKPGKRGITSPEKLCAWLHDRYSGTTRWRGKKSGLLVYKQADGHMRWVGWVSNHFRDNDDPPEIITGEAHQEYAGWADKHKAHPPLRLWHVPGADVGRGDFMEFTDGFLLSSGLFDQGKEAVAERLANMGPLSMSHSFVRLKSHDEDGALVTERYRMLEQSVLPKGAEANPWTRFDALKEDSIMLNDKKRRFLVDALGEDTVKGLEENTDALKAVASMAGVDWKQVEALEEEAQTVDSPDDAPEGSAEGKPADVDALTGALVERLVDPIAAAVTERLQVLALSDMVAGFRADIEGLKAVVTRVEALEGAMKEVKRSDDEKVEQKMTPKSADGLAWAQKAASKAEGTKVDTNNEQDRELVSKGPGLEEIAEKMAQNVYASVGLR